ncbi:receptor-like protein kinase FERONIA [Tanacetum coccineum]|uniref:Receptor-like protein kinase FERONIA n=1 Tax=Tanacetum coccineum TaxID=301880 RepID=A0ABQ5D224_9ASTR
MDKANGEAENLTSSTSAQPSRRFTIADIQSATNNFDDELVIGQGGFGKVYKGQISIEDSSHFVAIKRLDSISNQGAAEFKAEIEMLSKLRHCNLVSLIGYCDDNRELILVYVYVPHGTLYDHLHKVTATALSWIQRLKIAIGAGRGLDYLHAGFGTQRGVIHRDVKSSNILLDENWAAMISDFGLSKIGPIDQASNNISVSVKGTFGYLDPEYFYTSKLTRKTDMYAFGVVLFELLSGKLAVDTRLKEEQGSLARWAQKCVKERKFDQMVDSNIIGTFAPKVLRGFAEIANRCLIRDFEKRPSMTQVVAKLQDFLELQEKCDNSTDSPGTSGFTWMIRKYRASATNQNSGTIRLLPLAAKVKIAVGIAREIVYLCNTTDNVGKLASYFSQDSELYEWDKYKILLNEGRTWLIARSSAYNRSCSQTTGKSPFEVVYGCNPLSPLDLVPLPINSTYSGDGDERARAVKELHEKVKLKIEKQNQSKERFPPGRHAKLQQRESATFNVKDLSPYHGENEVNSRASSFQPRENDTVGVNICN